MSETTPRTKAEVVDYRLKRTILSVYYLEAITVHHRRPIHQDVAMETGYSIEQVIQFENNNLCDLLDQIDSNVATALLQTACQPASEAEVNPELNEPREDSQPKQPINRALNRPRYVPAPGPTDWTRTWSPPDDAD